MKSSLSYSSITASDWLTLPSSPLSSSSASISQQLQQKLELIRQQEQEQEQEQELQQQEEEETTRKPKEVQWKKDVAVVVDNDDGSTNQQSKQRKEHQHKQKRHRRKVPPSLAITQQNQKQLKPSNFKYIEGKDDIIYDDNTDSNSNNNKNVNDNNKINNNISTKYRTLYIKKVKPYIPSNHILLLFGIWLSFMFAMLSITSCQFMSMKTIITINNNVSATNQYRNNINNNNNNNNIDSNNNNNKNYDIDTTSSNNMNEQFNDNHNDDNHDDNNDDHVNDDNNKKYNDEYDDEYDDGNNDDGKNDDTMVEPEHRIMLERIMQSSSSKSLYQHEERHYLGFFSRPFLYHDDSDTITSPSTILGCIRYNNNDEFDSLFMASRTLIVISTLSISIALLFINYTLFHVGYNNNNNNNLHNNQIHNISHHSHNNNMSKNMKDVENYSNNNHIKDDDVHQNNDIIQLAEVVHPYHIDWIPFLWISSRYILAFATIIQMFTFMVLGSQACITTITNEENNNEIDTTGNGDGCQLSRVGVLAVFNTLLLAAISIMIFTEPIPYRIIPWITWYNYNQPSNNDVEEIQDDKKDININNNDDEGEEIMCPSNQKYNNDDDDDVIILSSMTSMSITVPTAAPSAVTPPLPPQHTLLSTSLTNGRKFIHYDNNNNNNDHDIAIDYNTNSNKGNQPWNVTISASPSQQRHHHQERYQKDSISLDDDDNFDNNTDYRGNETNPVSIMIYSVSSWMLQFACISYLYERWNLVWLNMMQYIQDHYGGDNTEGNDDDRLRTQQYQKQWRMLHTILIYVVWIIALYTTKRCTLIIVTPNDDGQYINTNSTSSNNNNEQQVEDTMIENIYSGLGLYTQSVIQEDDGQFLGCVSYPDSTKELFDSKFRTGRAFGTITIFIMTIILYLHNYGTLVAYPSYGIQTCWNIIRLYLLPCSTFTYLITFVVYGTDVCSSSTSLSTCHIGATGKWMIFNTFLYIGLNIIYYTILLPPKYPLLRINMNYKTMTTDDGKIIINPWYSLWLQFIEKIKHYYDKIKHYYNNRNNNHDNDDIDYHRTPTTTGNANNTNRIIRKEEFVVIPDELDYTNNNNNIKATTTPMQVHPTDQKIPYSSSPVERMKVQIIYYVDSHNGNEKKKTIKTLHHYDGSQTIKTIVEDVIMDPTDDDDDDDDDDDTYNTEVYDDDIDDVDDVYNEDGDAEDDDIYENENDNNDSYIPKTKSAVNKHTS